MTARLKWTAWPDGAWSLRCGTVMWGHVEPLDDGRWRASIQAAILAKESWTCASAAAGRRPVEDFLWRQEWEAVDIEGAAVEPPRLPSEKAEQLALI